MLRGRAVRLGCPSGLPAGKTLERLNPTIAVSMKLLPAWSQRIFQFVGYTALFIALLWSILALWYLHPPLPRLAARLLSIGWFLSIVLLFFGGRAFGLRPFLAHHAPWLPRWATHGVNHSAALGAALIGFFAIRFAWELKLPSDNREWVADQARTPVARFAEGSVTIENVRNTLYRTDEDFDVRWEARSYPLDQIRSLDIFIEPFMEWQGISHFLLSFGFENGEYLCFSVEARVEAAESFGILPALFKEYELIYIAGDERDLLHRRVNLQNHDVYRYRIHSRNRENLRALFVLILNHGAKLKSRPQFYNTLIRNCTNSQLRHVEYLSASNFPWWDYRLIFPGYVDAMLYEYDAIDTSTSLAELRLRSRINENAPPPGELSGPEWSALIRTPVGPSSN